MSDPKYTQGVCADGAAILKDGVMMTIEEILAELNTRPGYKWKTFEEWWAGNCHGGEDGFPGRAFSAAREMREKGE